MQTEPPQRRRQPGRGRRGESGQGRAEPRGTEPRAAVMSARSSREETARLKEIVTTSRQQKEKQAGERGRREEEEEERERGGGGGGGGRDRSRGDGGGRREVRSRRAASEGGEEGEQVERLRWRLHQLEKQNLELTSGHNQEVCGLQAELTRLRSAVERGEAQRVELQYQLTVSRRDADRASELTERAADLQQTLQEMQRARQAREEDQHALQREVEERDGLIQNFSSENQRLHRLLQDHEEALEEAERRMVEVQKEREKEAEVNRRQANELKYLTEREERSRREQELSDQRVKSLESSIEAERAAHLESKFNSEIIQLRLRDVEAALVAERSSQQEAQRGQQEAQRGQQEAQRGQQEAQRGQQEAQRGQQEAQRGQQLLTARLREVERAHGEERERSGGTERALQRLQEEYEQCKSDMSVALETERKTTSDLTERLEEEKRRHANTHTQLEQAARQQADTEEAFRNCVNQIRETVQQHGSKDTGPPAKDDGSRNPSAEVVQLLKTTLCTYRHTLDQTDRQVQDLLSASERLQEENRALWQLSSDQSRQVEEARQAALRLGEEVTRLRQDSSDWSTQSRSLRAELEREREEREREREEREREREEREREREEREREREEREREKEREREEVQKITDQHQKESKARLSFLYCLYQRLLAGCVLLHQPQSILGNFTWKELCDVINEQVDQLTSDLRKANDQIARLQSVCEKKSVCVRELQRSQACVLSRLEESVRRREEAWSSQHTHTVSQLQRELQACRSQCGSLRDHASSLELRGASLTSDLCGSRGESSCFLSACALLAGALTHAHRRLQALRTQKTLLSRRLAEREALEEEVRRLAAALGCEEEEEEEGGWRRRRALRRWRRSVCVVLAVRRWCALTETTTVLFRVETAGGAAAVCVCGESATATHKAQIVPSTGGRSLLSLHQQETAFMSPDDDEERAGVCARWLRSKCLSSTILSSMADLQGALAHTGSSPPDVMSAARSGLSRLLDRLLDQSDTASSIPPPCGAHEDSLSGRLRLGLSRLTPAQPDTQTLVSSLQQHFLLFSQRLHSAEVERRSLRLEVANLKSGLRREREETVPAERFSSVCVELRQALSREQEAQMLVQEQTDQLHTLQQRVNTHTCEQSATQHTLQQTTQSLAEARREVSRKERSLRILGKHLSGVQRERKHLEERLQRVEDELRDATRRQEHLIRSMKTAERSCQELRESLVQSRHSLSAQPRPLLLTRGLLELSGAESIMGAPEVAACQSLLSTFSQLYHTCSSRIDWLEQEVSAHRSHVTALRSELQDACLRDNLAFVPVAEFPETFPFADVETPPPVPRSDWSQELSVCVSPAPSPPLSKPPRTKLKEKKATKKNRGHVRR